MDSIYKRPKSLLERRWLLSIVCIFLVLGTLAYFQIRQAQHRQLIKGYSEKLSSDMQAIDRNMTESLRIIQYLSKNAVLERVLLGNYPNYVLANKEVIENLDTSYYVLTTSTRSNIDKLWIYAMRELPPHGNFIFGKSLAQIEPWYEHFMQQRSQLTYIEEGQIFVIYPVFRSKNSSVIGAIKVRLNRENLIESILDYEGFELSWGDSLVFTRSHREPVAKGLWYNLGLRRSIGVNIQSDKTDFHLSYRISKPSFFSGGFVMLLLIILSGVMIVLISIAYSRRLELEYRHLRDEEQRSSHFERLLLKAQISPHFLYNIMSMINWKAKFSGNEEISQICLELSDFYRTALNKGIEEIPVREELKNIQAYIQLKLRMIETPFSYEIHCPEIYEECRIINFILQPIVENAILHGMGSREDGGHIAISVKAASAAAAESSEDLILRVVDNGLRDFNVDEIWQAQKGYGIKNVHERIIYRYGEAYGVSIVREGGFSTLSIRLPRIYEAKS